MGRAVLRRYGGTEMTLVWISWGAVALGRWWYRMKHLGRHADGVSSADLVDTGKSEWAHRMVQEHRTGENPVRTPDQAGRDALEPWWRAPEFAGDPAPLFDELSPLLPAPFDEELLSFTASWTRAELAEILAGAGR